MDNSSASEAISAEIAAMQYARVTNYFAGEFAASNHVSYAYPLINCAIVCALGLVTWEYFLVLDEEVVLIWRRKLGSSLPRWIFYSSRYVTPVILIYIITGEYCG